MRLSSKTGIGIRALFDMAFHCRGRQAQAREIAQRQRISVRTVEEVLQDLRKSGLISAQRGRHGGYVLARAAEEITVSAIVRALEGPVERMFPLDDGPAAAAPAAVRRQSFPGAATAVAPVVGHPLEAVAADVPALIWGDIAGRIATVLEDVTLGDFIKRAESAGLKREIAQPQMYFI